VRGACAPTVSLTEYKQQLQSLSRQIEALKDDPARAGELVATIPDSISITSGTGEVQVNYKSLKDDLTAFAKADAARQATFLPKIQKYLEWLSAAAESYEKSGANTADARGKLNDILSRREFNKVKGPDAKDALLARLFRWLSRMLDKLSVHGGSNFDWMRLFIYVLVAAAAALLGVWTFRRLRRPHEELAAREIIPFAPSARSWRTWLAEARALAQQQDWRNAIHLAYWAGISYLEEHGAWKPNRARTPREYLRLIGSRAAQYPVLSALTRKLELVWYGYHSASAADFDEAVGQLEKLGCR